MRTCKLAIAISILAACAAAQPTVFTGGVLNGASFTKGQAVAPGAEVAIYGSGLASTTVDHSTVPLSISLGGTSVTFNGVSAPLYFVSDGQVNAQMPWSMTAGTATIVVTKGGVQSAPVSVSIANVAPGVFSTPAGAGYAIAINADGTLAAPAGAIPGLITHPAHAGDTLVVYATGLGAVSPADANGAASLDALRTALITPGVTIGGKSAAVAFAGLTPQFPAINQLNVVVPSGVTGNSLPLQLIEGGITTTDQVVIAVQ
jgi:uncharacterized protein (TIGR03437 family)